MESNYNFILVLLDQGILFRKVGNHDAPLKFRVPCPHGETVFERGTRKWQVEDTIFWEYHRVFR